MSKVRVIFGPQGEPIEIHEKPSSAVAAGTDREQAVTPVTEDGICPTCGQVWGETCSDGGQAADPEMLLREDDYIVDIDDGEEDETEESINELLA